MAKEANKPNSKEENSNKEKESVEQNLSQDYIPKAKLGNLPINNQLAIPENVRKEMEKTKKDIDDFKEQIIKKYDYIEAIGIIPVQAAQKIEEEYEIPEEECKKKLIHILVIIPEDKFKEIGKFKTDAIEISRKINNKLWVHAMTPVDIWNFGLDSKFDILEALAMSFPILDKGILGAIAVSEIHKTLVLQKFEKYVTSYVIAGSLTRGQATKTSDVDVFVVIDDTDVKRMSRLELKEKLRGIIYGYITQAEAMSGVKNVLSIQVYLLTEFWESVKDASPLMFTFIRDGIPLYDRGAFLPWKTLLKMGKIKPSPESIDMFMSSGDRMEEMVKRRLLDLVIGDIYWSVLTPSQGLLMLFGLAPTTHKETVAKIQEIFVDKEKLLEQKYADILKVIVIDYYKGYEHGKVKEVSGKEVDKLLKDAIDYAKRLKELRKQIEKRVDEKKIQQIYNDLFGMLSGLTKEKEEQAIIKKFESDFIKLGKFPQRFLEGIKYTAKVKEEMQKEEKEEKKGKKKAKEMAKEAQQDINKVDQARKQAEEIIHVLIEHQQRCEFLSSIKSKYTLKAGERKVEILFLDNTFVIQDNKLFKLQGGKLKETPTEELEKQLAENRNKETKINTKAIHELKDIFGDFELLS